MQRDLKGLNLRTDELELLANVAPNGDLLYTKDCKKGKKNTLGNRRRWRNEKHKEFIYFYLFVLLLICIFISICNTYLLHHCAFQFIFIIYFLFFMHKYVYSILADSGPFIYMVAKFWSYQENQTPPHNYTNIVFRITYNNRRISIIINILKH